MKKEYTEPSEETKNRINHIKKVYDFKGLEKKKGFEPALEYIVRLMDGDRVIQEVMYKQYNTNTISFRECYKSIIKYINIQDEIDYVKQKEEK
jgi:hypothetical protein